MINIIPKNVFNSTITASSTNPDITFNDGLLDRSLAKIGRTVSNADQWIQFSFTGAVDVDTVVVFANNFTPSATVKIQANATDVWTSPTIDQALTYVKDDRKSDQLDKEVGIWFYQFSSTESYQYWRLSIDDTTNTDDFLDVGLVVLDEKTVFPGMSVNQVFKRESTSDPEFNMSNQIYGIKRTQYNGASFNFPIVSETQKTTLDSFFNQADLVLPYCMFVWENDTSVQIPLYVANAKLPEWKRVETMSGLNWTFNLEIREVF